MRLARLAIISFLFLFLLITGISLFVPSRVRVSRAINIKAGKDSILAQINDAANWRHWHPGLENARLIVKNGQAVGAVLDSSDSKHPVTLLITETDSNSVTARFDPRKLEPVTMAWKTLRHSDTDSITVQWYMDFHLRWYPWEKFSSLMFERAHGARMEEGLTSLRNYMQYR